MSKAFAQPRASARTTTIQISTTPLKLRMVRIAARSIITAWTAMRVWRLGSVSARRPANRPRIRTGTNWAAATTRQSIAVRELEDEPGLGDLLHPRSD
jgi:hypothetical protein